MKVILFKLHSKMAHFRKFYSNSTALSYYIPPVTTIKGILAGLLGMERDAYYDIFSNDNCMISISILSTIKKITQVMNLLNVKNTDDLIGAGQNRTQTDTEWIIPANIRKDDICYGICVWHKDEQIFNAIAEKICTNDEYYKSNGISLALGSAQCLGWITSGKILDAKENIAKDEILSIHSSTPKKDIKSIDYAGLSKINLMKEESIIEFDAYRRITEGSKIEIIASGNGNPMNLILNEGSIYYTVEEKNIVFIR